MIEYRLSPEDDELDDLDDARLAGVRVLRPVQAQDRRAVNRVVGQFGLVGGCLPCERQRASLRRSR